MADMELVEVVGRRSRTLSGQTEPETSWIGQTFQKRECTKFIPSQIDRFANRCGCGRLILEHHYLNQTGAKADDVLPMGASASSITNRKATFTSSHSNIRETVEQEPTDGDLKWKGLQHTSLLPTDAYGTLEFQGTGEGDKSQYIRLSHDTNPSIVLQLLLDEWKLRPPKMVITVHGGAHNFQLQPKLHRVFCNGLIKAAKTTGAWVMSFGLNTGVGAIVGNALKEHKAKSNGKIFSIGVAPWGVVDHREDLIGPEPIRSYQTMSNPLSKGAVLHTAYSHFLLADNGTAGRYDSELRFRRQLEKRLSHQQLNSCTGGHSQTCSMVCLVLEGGKNTINVVLESLRQTPPIPVIVCDGSGRAADLLAFAHQYANEDGIMIEELRAQLLSLVQETFKCSKEQSNYFFISIMECVKRKDLITVFRMGQSCTQDDIDIAILTATLKARCKSAPDMLGLALSWNRIDIATSQIFVYGQQWPILSLERAMMEALINERVDFVKILMENGVSMHKFLTVTRLEDLYNAQPPVNLVYLVNDVKKNIPPGYRFTLLDIGQVIEFLMGGAYRSSYTRKRFRILYSSKMRFESGVKKQPSFRIGSNAFGNLTKNESNHVDNSAKPPASVVGLKSVSEQPSFPTHFQYPFHELIIWAVLTKRHRMALFMWQQGEEAIAKALVACKLYKTMAKEAAEDDLDVEESEQLRKYSKEFQDLSILLLEICYRTDDDATQHLLTQELKQWSRHTCLSLAVAAKHRDFIAHPCVQLLLNDLWMGGMSERKNSGLKVIVGILLPPSILTLAFKTQEELQLMPQTMEEHLHDASSISSSIKGSNSSSHSSSSASSSSSSSKSSNSEIFPKPEVLGKLPEHSKQDPYTLITTRPRQLTLSKKIYEFYNAPITKFWMYAMAYIVILLLFTYVVLVRMESYPSIPELIVISYVITMTMEKIREIVVSEPSGAKKKLKVWISHFWNLMDILTILMFYTGLGLRLSQDEEILQIGRAFYCSNIVLWYTHLLNIISVSKHLGPYVMLMGKMMVDLATFIILLAVVLMSFGVARQALLHPNETGSWTLLQDVVMEPYFMLYGEVYAGTIDPCRGDDPSLCVTGAWIAPTLMTMYLLVANILLLNLLIAVFNNTFARVKNYSDTIWKFQRYMTIVEFELRPVLPPPLILFSYIFMFFRSCWKKRKNALSDRGLKLFLDDEDVEKLHDFEEDCVDEYFRSKNKTKASDTLVKDDRIGKVLDSLEEMIEKQNFLTSQYFDFQERLSLVEDANKKSSEYMRTRRHTSSMSADPDLATNSVLGILPERQGRMLLKRRPRHESELSSTSDWHPVNYRTRTMGQDQPKQNDLSNFDTGIRRTTSTGILAEKKSFEDKVNYFTKKDNMSLSEDDNKAVSCQDIIVRVQSQPNQSTKDHNLTRKVHPSKLSTNSNKNLLDPDEPRYFGSVSDDDQISHFSPRFEEKQRVNFDQLGNEEGLEKLPKNKLVVPEIHTSMTRNNQSFPKISQFNSSMQCPGSSRQSDSFQPTYRSITDNIDTSKWHEMFSPSIPLTPFDGFWSGSKTPDFGGSRVLREQSSLSDWDEEDVIEFRTKKSTNRHHRKKNQNKHHKKTHSPNNMAASLPSSPKLNKNNNSDVATNGNSTLLRLNLSENSPDLPPLKYVCSESTLLLSNHTSPFDFYEY